MKPCPFCGGEPDSVPTNCIGHWAIYCPCCEYYGPVGRSSELAKEAWNVRAYEDQNNLRKVRKRQK